MKYLFEDKKEDKFSKLFCSSLPDDIKKNIYYAQGNGYLVSEAEKLLRNGEKVIVFLDTVPNNNIRKIYYNLRRLSRLSNHRLIVWNIVCAEFYFIKAFAKRKDLQCFIKNDDLDIVLMKKPYQNASIIASDEDILYTKSFEKFCKLFVKKNSGSCVEGNTIFFTDDCACNDNCTKIALSDKSLEYRNAYDFLLRADYTDNELWEIHRKLVDDANEMIKKFNDSGCVKFGIYNYIKE